MAMGFEQYSGPLSDEMVMQQYRAYFEKLNDPEFMYQMYEMDKMRQQWQMNQMQGSLGLLRNEPGDLTRSRGALDQGRP